MATLKKVLVAYDDSPHSKAALCWAMLFADDENCELKVVKVFEPMGIYFDLSVKLLERYVELEEQDRQMMQELKPFCESCGKSKVETQVLKGPVASTLLEYARQQSVDLIVSGTKGHGALEEMLVGSVTNNLVSLAKAPLLVVKDTEAPSRLQKILVAYDGSAHAKKALELAADLAKTRNAKLILLKVAEPRSLMLADSLSESESGSVKHIAALLQELEEAEKTMLDEGRQMVARMGVEAVTVLLSAGNIVESLLQYAEKENADLIAAGNLGHGFLEGILIGSTTRNLIALSKIPLLLVKGEAVRRSDAT